jgi:hypothetical protein
MMYEEALNWIQTAYPYWNRLKGRDHVWLFAHDEGACWAPAEVYANSIILTQYGLAPRPAPPEPSPLDFDGLTSDAAASESAGPRSMTTRPGFNFSEESASDDERLPGGWTRRAGGHACFTPEKDLVLPSFSPPALYHAAMSLGALHRRRDILLLMRGDLGDGRAAEFSAGLRQEVYGLARDGNWNGKYSIKMGNAREIEGEYSVLLSRSTYCLVLPGDGWVGTFEEAVIHGCTPVYVTGGPRDLHPPFADQLKWGSFSIAVDRSELPRLPQILTNVDPKQLLNMQRRAARIWHRLAWLDHAAVLAQAADVMRSNLATFPAVAAEHRHMEKLVREGKMGDTIFPRNGVRLMRRSDASDDAFNTVMQLLYTKSRQLHGDAIRGGELALLGGGGGGAGGGRPQVRRRRRLRRRRRRQAGVVSASLQPSEPQPTMPAANA